MSSWTIDELCRLIDHTNLHADASERDIAKLCDEAKRYHFKMVAINQTQVGYCARALAGTDIHVGAAISFPLGQTTIAAKVFETTDALANGADEIDYVVNLTQVKEGNWDYVEEEMRRIVGACEEAHAISKVIFENCYLTEDEKVRLCQIARTVRPTFVKTSTGFGTGGATAADVRLMCEQVAGDVQVKAAGGIREVDTFLDLIRAGARRIGCSASIPLIEGIRERMSAAGVSALSL